MSKLALFIAILALAYACSPPRARSAPPLGVDPESSASGWYRSLKDARGTGCCDEADCRRVAYRVISGVFEVFIDRKTFGRGAPNAWVPVPPEAVLPRENPTGEGVACYYGGIVHCFVQAGAT